MLEVQENAEGGEMCFWGSGGEVSCAAAFLKLSLKMLTASGAPQPRGNS